VNLLEGDQLLRAGKADIRAIPQHTAMSILAAVHRLAENGAGPVKRLKDTDPPEFRLRVGNYRVRFTEHTSGTLRINSARNRKEAYR